MYESMKETMAGIELKPAAREDTGTVWKMQVTAFSGLLENYQEKMDRKDIADAAEYLINGASHSLNGAIELDVSTKESHRGKKLATACVARMLQDCMERGITVHWDAQNGASRHLAEKFGFEIETEYSVYWLP